MGKNYSQSMSIGQTQYMNRYNLYLDLEKDHPL